MRHRNTDEDGFHRDRNFVRPEYRLEQQEDDRSEDRGGDASGQTTHYAEVYLRPLSSHFPEVQDLSVCVVLPAYHAAKTLEATLDRLPNGSCQDIILVDDASTDDTI